MSPNPMVTKTARTQPGPVGIAVLEQLAELDVQSISPETAQKLLSFQFDDSHHERVRLL